jgi:DNA-directed RNA polymerase specialized sigma24 family protein
VVYADALVGSPSPSRRRRAAGEGGPFFEVRASLEIVGRNGAAQDGRKRTQDLLDWLLRNGRREQLCAEVAASSGAPRELVEDALQEVCERAAATDKCRGSSEGEVYKWLLTATVHRVGKLLGRAHRRREVLVDPDGALLERLGAGDGADVEVLEREREREVAELVRTAIEPLTERQRQQPRGHGRRRLLLARGSRRRVPAFGEERVLSDAEPAARSGANGVLEFRPFGCRLNGGATCLPRDRSPPDRPRTR